VTPAFEKAEFFLERRELWAAGDAFSQLRPPLKSTLEGLMLSARIHAAAKRWSNVDVLCRVIRKEFPTEAFGFAAGAESLRQQGYDTEAASMLNLWMTAPP
jgi:hypothetical protein